MFSNSEFFQSQDYKIEEGFVGKPRTFEILNLYSNQDATFLNGVQFYKEGSFKQSLEVFSQASKKEPGNLDYILALATCLLTIGSLNEALLQAHKAVNLVNKYHCHFHYFGFNLCMKIAKLAQEPEEFLKRAEFLYPEGFKTLMEPNIKGDALPEFKDLCIFLNSTTQKMCEEENLEAFLKALEISEEEHFNYHLIASQAHFIRGMIFKLQKSPEIAKIEFEKALKMEAKNPYKHLILKELT